MLRADKTVYAKEQCLHKNSRE